MLVCEPSGIFHIIFNSVAHNQSFPINTFRCGNQENSIIKVRIPSGAPIPDEPFSRLDQIAVLMMIRGVIRICQDQYIVRCDFCSKGIIANDDLIVAAPVIPAHDDWFAFLKDLRYQFKEVYPLTFIGGIGISSVIPVDFRVEGGIKVPFLSHVLFQAFKNVNHLTQRSSSRLIFLT